MIFFLLAKKSRFVDTFLTLLHFPSVACKDLVQRLLTFSRENRITLDEVLNHEWLQKGFDGPIIPIVFPNYPQPEELDKNIVRHMVDKMEFKQQEIVDAVAKNR